MRLGAGVQLAFVLVDSAKDRNRRAILRKITTLFGTSVPPALPNDHENTSKASRAFTLRPNLSEMRLGEGVQLAFVLVDSAKDRDRRASLRSTMYRTLTTPASVVGPQSQRAQFSIVFGNAGGTEVPNKVVIFRPSISVFRAVDEIKG